MLKHHSFHIPVMGIGYTIDTAIKVSPFGIDSVISLVDDILLEKLRKLYCNKYDLQYREIKESSHDSRADRITQYLNMINELIDKKIGEMKNATQDKIQEIKKYFEMLPDGSGIKKEFNNLTSKYFNTDDLKNWLNKNLSKGSVDVNIMTKVDKENYEKKEKLPVIFNDAHAAVRGFAKSNLESSIVLSAGMNTRLFSYLESFDDFYPDENGMIKKKIILKVSDFKSAFVQGKFLAKKGLWVSEFRVESGLNCGGHAFATDGHLLGPVLAEFKSKKEFLKNEIETLLKKSLKEKDKPVPDGLTIKYTAQGGVGTNEEHQFLLDEFELDSVGWGSPFLLAPDVTNIDTETLNKLETAEEDDLYLSDISPLGIPFNSLKGNTKDIEKDEHIASGRPGSACPKRFAALNGEFTDKHICTASRKYQKSKIEELDKKNLSEEEYRFYFNKIVEKSCICVGLGTPALIVNELSTKIEGKGVSVCPGPNIAYFDKKTDLKEMTDHIYGRTNLLAHKKRPNMFVKELQLNIGYLKSKILETKFNGSLRIYKQLQVFNENLMKGIDFYIQLFSETVFYQEIKKKELIIEFNNLKNILDQNKHVLNNKILDE
jgi:hypothetical protein